MQEKIYYISTVIKNLHYTANFGIHARSSNYRPNLLI